MALYRLDQLYFLYMFKHESPQKAMGPDKISPRLLSMCAQ